MGTNRIAISISCVSVLTRSKNEKVIQNPYADLDQHQKLITSRGSPLAHACQVLSMSVSHSSVILFTE